MNVVPVMIGMPDDVPAQIDALVGKNRRADFIRRAVEAALDRLEQPEGSTGPILKPPREDGRSVTRTSVRLAEDVLERMDRVIGRRQRPDFIWPAIEQALIDSGGKTVSEPKAPEPGIVQMRIRLDEGLPRRIDALVGKDRRGEFIREAIELLLAQRERPRHEK